MRPDVVEEGDSLAESIFPLDPKTTVAGGNNCSKESFDKDSISSRESLQNEEAVQRDSDVKSKMVVDEVESDEDADDSPIPVKGNIFHDYEPDTLGRRIRNEAAELRKLGGGDFPPTPNSKDQGEDLCDSEDEARPRSEHSNEKGCDNSETGTGNGTEQRPG